MIKKLQELVWPEHRRQEQETPKTGEVEESTSYKATCSVRHEETGFYSRLAGKPQEGL